MLEFRDVWEKDGCVCSRERREKGRKEIKVFFFNSTGIILRGNILCISYNSSPGPESYCSKSKKKIGDGEAIGVVFLCEQWLFWRKNRDSLTVGDALTKLSWHVLCYLISKNLYSILQNAQPFIFQLIYMQLCKVSIVSLKLKTNN